LLKWEDDKENLNWWSCGGSNSSPKPRYS